MLLFEAFLAVLQLHSDPSAGESQVVSELLVALQPLVDFISLNKDYVSVSLDTLLVVEAFLLDLALLVTGLDCFESFFFVVEDLLLEL